MSLIMGTQAGNRLTGTAQRDVIIGLGGDDEITGEGGRDLLLGGDGNDHLTTTTDWWQFGRGPNTLYGGAGEDTLRGSGDNDLLDGGDGVDRLSGNDGDDLLLGGNGTDLLYGDDGDDLLLGGNGDDWRLSGDDGDDLLLGGDGADHLEGGSGADTFIGGAGDDSYGADVDGLGEDVFVFQASKGAGGFGHDEVYKFDLGADQLRFVGYTEADLARPVKTTTIESKWEHQEQGDIVDYHGYDTEWRFDFQDGSWVTVEFSRGAHHPQDLYPHPSPPPDITPVAGQDYVFA